MMKCLGRGKVVYLVGSDVLLNQCIDFVGLFQHDLGNGPISFYIIIYAVFENDENCEEQKMMISIEVVRMLRGELELTLLGHMIP